jgi:RNA polymerase sigma-70 factor, ECF subfamily
MCDEELMILIKEDNEDAFNILYEKYRDIIYRYVISIIGYNQFVEDIFHDVFLSIFINRKTYSAISKFSTYIFSVVRSKCIDFLRKNSKYLGVNDSYINEIEFNEENDKKILNKDIRRDFIELLNIFPEKQKSSLYLKDIAELGYEEISEIINIPLGTVKTLIHRGREIIYKELRRKYE